MTAAENPGEVRLLMQVFDRMGASEAQARTMASQLLKRAGQLARERGSSREDELRYLLDRILAGQEGRIGEGPLSRSEAP